MKSRRRFRTWTGSVDPGGSPRSGRRASGPGTRRRVERGPQGPKTKQNKARRDAGLAAGPRKFRAGGAAPSEPGKGPGRAIAMAGPGTSRRAARGAQPRSGAPPPPRGDPKGAVSGRPQATNPRENESFHSKPDATGGLPGYTGSAPRRIVDVGKIHEERGDEKVDEPREPPRVRIALCGGSLEDSTHGGHAAPRRQSLGL